LFRGVWSAPLGGVSIGALVNKRLLMESEGKEDIDEENEEEDDSIVIA